MKLTTKYAKPYTDKWFKELKQALSVPTFKVTPPKNPMPLALKTIEDDRYESGERPLNARELAIANEAIALIKGARK